jgi:hypothetical protein
MLEAIGSERAVVVMIRIKSLGLAIRRRSEQIDHRFGVEGLPRLLNEVHVDLPVDVRALLPAGRVGFYV